MISGMNERVSVHKDGGAVQDDCLAHHHGIRLGQSRERCLPDTIAIGTPEVRREDLAHHWKVGDHVDGNGPVIVFQERSQIVIFSQVGFAEVKVNLLLKLLQEYLIVDRMRSIERGRHGDLLLSRSRVRCGIRRPRPVVERNTWVLLLHS